MDFIFLIGALVVMAVLFLLFKVIFQSIHIVFYALLIVLVVIFIFGISLAQVTDWFLQALLWVL